MSRKKRPNILLIHADQHRWDCLGSYGNLDISTPHLDRLAADGVRYENCFCTYPVCTPSRYSMFTGLYVHQHLGWTNHSTLPTGLTTFPEILKNAGYHTRAVGKMHFTPTYLDLGFAEMILAEQDGPGRHDDDYHRYLREKGLYDEIDLMDQVAEFRAEAPEEYRENYGALKSNLQEEDHSTTWIGNRALEALEHWDSKDSGGNFLMVGFIKPHHPFDPPEPWNEMYNPDSLSLLPGWLPEGSPEDGYFPYRNLKESQLRRVMAYYYALISQLDHQVGKMLTLLREKGLYKNTMIIYTGDHGDYLGFGRRLLKGSHLYDPLVRIPLIIKYPADPDDPDDPDVPGYSAADPQILKGCTAGQLVSNVDLAPTILNQAGCQSDPAMVGKDLLLNPAGHEAVFAEGLDGEEYMVRTAGGKLLLRRDKTASMFFKLKEDPLERVNLFTEPSSQGEIRNYLDKLSDWMLFAARTPVNLEEDGPVIAGENVPRTGAGHRENSLSYFRRKMKEANKKIKEANKKMK